MYASKDKVRAVIVSGGFRIEGDLHILAGTRLTDALNSKGKDFFPVTDATITRVGETEPLYAVLSGYQVTENDGTLSLSFVSLETSREWLNQLLKDLLPANAIRLPSNASRYAGIIRLLLE